MNSADPGEELVRWHAENPYDRRSAGRQGEQQARTAQMEHDDQIRVQTEFNVRAQQLCGSESRLSGGDQSADGMYDWHGDASADQYITRSPVGPEIEYLMCQGRLVPEQSRHS